MTHGKVLGATDELGAPLGYTHFNLFLELCLRRFLRPQSSQVAEPEQILPFPQRECAFLSPE